MPTFADLLSPTARTKLAAVHIPEVPSYDVLEAERVANLERIATEHQASLLSLSGVADALMADPATHETVMDVIAENNLAAICGELDAQDAEDAELAVTIERMRRSSSEPRETVGAIRKPQTKKRQPRLTCTPQEQASAEAKEATMNHKINLSHLSDAQLGRMMRAALLTLVVDDLPESMAEALAIKTEKAIDREALRDDDRAERKANPDYRQAGFTVGTLEVPALDLTGVVMGELVPSKVRSAYNRARYRLGATSVLPADGTTWELLGAEHKRLAELAGEQPAPKVAIVAELDPEAMAKKVATLAEVLGISEKAAAKRIKAMNA